MAYWYSSPSFQSLLILAKLQINFYKLLISLCGQYRSTNETYTYAVFELDK
ncbi:hypothetical protein [Flectobacillus major]|uniref:hypothetical protein n=1 Tax=Flectobacillus major TaxID=103 RepID=UPI000426F241|nr:hypothetical protein [Flectobacillus major]